MNGTKKIERHYSKFNTKFFEDVAPTKLTEGRKVKLHTIGWGILTEYFLESAKITRQKNGEVTSAVTLKIGDKSGQIVCLIRGPTVGILFGMSSKEWVKVERLCGPKDQLFYRYFKDGLSPNYKYEQKLFYNFCSANQKTDVLLAVFKRSINIRNKDKNDAFLEIIHLRKCDSNILDLYINNLRKNINLNEKEIVSF